MSESLSADLLRRMQADDARLRQTETKEVPGGIPGFSSFYASGTWIPTLVGATIGGTFTYNALTSGTWTRLGNTVLFRGRIVITTVTIAPTGNLSIQGLPIAAAVTTNGTPGGAQFDFWSIVNLGGGAFVYLGGWIQSAQSKIDLLRSQNAGGGTGFLTGAVAAVANGTDMAFQGQYQA